MKTNIQRFGLVLAVAGLLMMSQPLLSQDSDDQLFMRELVRIMERNGWSTSETGQLERHMLVYKWERLKGVDPEIIALALQYGRDQSDKELNFQQTARLVQRLAYTAGEMVKLGFDGRDITRVVIDETRLMIEQRWRLNENSPELSQQTRDQIRMQIMSAEGDRLKEQLRTRTRTSNPKSPDSWPSPGPHGETGKADPPNPQGPGNGQDSPGSGHGR